MSTAGQAVILGSAIVGGTAKAAEGMVGDAPE